MGAQGLFYLDTAQSALEKRRRRERRDDVLLVGGITTEGALFDPGRMPIGFLPKPIDTGALEREIARAVSERPTLASTGGILR